MGKLSSVTDKWHWIHSPTFCPQLIHTWPLPFHSSVFSVFTSPKFDSKRCQHLHIQNLQWNIADSRYKLSTLDTMTISLNVPVKVTARTQSFDCLACQFFVRRSIFWPTEINLWYSMHLGWAKIRMESSKLSTQSLNRIFPFSLRIAIKIWLKMEFRTRHSIHSIHARVAYFH